MKPDFTLRFIKEQNQLTKLCEILTQTPAFAIDIETVDWWNRHQERVALIQIAFRFNKRIIVAVIDALARLDIEHLRMPLENPSILKIIHNAGFDAVKLLKHYDFQTAPIHDTMLAARRSGERRYSLKAQAATHLDIIIDKSVQLSDWSRRPLGYRQLYYAALDSYSTLLLYENQIERNLSGEYRLRSPIDLSRQGRLLLDNSPAANKAGASLTLEKNAAISESVLPGDELYSASAAILGIVSELPERYSPAQLAVSLGTDQRVGLAGWIIDNRLGKDADLDEETVKLTIADLCERGLVRMTETRRLESTEKGTQIWLKLKSG